MSAQRLIGLLALAVQPQRKYLARQFQPLRPQRKRQAQLLPLCQMFAVEQTQLLEANDGDS